jgi:large subunit ribosomal protein L21
MAYAIIEISGTQLRVEPGRFYDVNRIAGDVDSQVTIDKVLLIQNDGDISVGQPLVEGATVTATLLRHMRGRKVIVYKMKPKKKTRKKRGHRQELTRLMIDSISLQGSVLAERAENSEKTVLKVSASKAEAATDEAEE